MGDGAKVQAIENIPPGEMIYRRKGAVAAGPIGRFSEMLGRSTRAIAKGEEFDPYGRESPVATLVGVDLRAQRDSGWYVLRGRGGQGGRERGAGRCRA